MKSITPAWLIGSTALVSFSLVGISFLLLGINEESVRLTLRETARISVVLFIIVFATSSLHALFKNEASKWLMRNRRYLGISFAVSHLIHLVLIIWLIAGYADGDLFSIAPLSSFILGGIGYVFIIAMLLTSNNRAVRLLGHKRWKVLHKTGMYCLFLIFLVSYIGLLELNFAFHLPFVVLLALAFVSRITVYFSKQKRLQTA